MRDLSGRRQRDINNERRLKDYIAGAVNQSINYINGSVPHHNRGIYFAKYYGGGGMAAGEKNEN